MRYKWLAGIETYYCIMYEMLQHSVIILQMQEENEN